jgi:hypothetical protein
LMNEWMNEWMNEKAACIQMKLCCSSFWLLALCDEGAVMMVHCSLF